MEVAGLVFGALPLAITALQCFKTGRSLKDAVRNRERHVQRLVRALQGQRAILELYLVWLLKAVRAYDELYHTPHHIPFLLQDGETVSRIDSFLGRQASDAFQDAVIEAYEAVLQVMRGVEGLLPDGDNKVDAPSLRILQSKGTSKIKVQFQGGMKLFLRKKEIDDQIARLDSATNLLNKLQSAILSTQQADTRIQSNSSTRLANSLKRVRNYASRLHKAILLSWDEKCHSSHETRLFLEDCVNKHRLQASCYNNKSINFKVIFTSDSNPDILWHEGEIEVVQMDDEDEVDSRGSASSTTPRVSFLIASSGVSTQAPGTMQVDSICSSVDLARQRKKFLRLFLPAQTKLHYDCTLPCKDHSHQTVMKTISLSQVLAISSMTTNRSFKMSPKGQMLLALKLASTLLQLNGTPWFSRLWSKEGIHFLVHMNDSTLSFDPSKVDITRPLALQIHEGSATAPSQQALDPRTTMLEFGILLLEIWNEVPFEEHFKSQPTSPNDDPFHRMALAFRWLDESEGTLLPLQIEVASRCIKCMFDGASPNPSWDDPRLLNGFAAGVVEPLYNIAYPRYG